MITSKKRGFTLIELLVVIAIIAILAAILFPVFARAREKARQTTCSSNQRQIAASAQMYVQDHEESFPGTASFWQAIAVDPGVLVCPSKGKTTPNGYAYNYLLDALAIGTIADPTKAFITCDSDKTNNLWIDNVDSAKRHSGQCLYSYVDGHVAPTADSPIPYVFNVSCYAANGVTISGSALFTKNIYFPNTDPVIAGATGPTGLDFTQNDLNWGAGSAWTGGLTDNFGIVWKGKMKVPTSGTYNFYGQADDSAYLKITDPITKAMTTLYSFTNNTSGNGNIALTAGLLYDFEMFNGETGGGATGSYRMTPPGGVQARIPNTIFPTGLEAYGK
jgi:prepilin-type N-terminal cleavage/methylation domain-containing protein/prepilin-type processing-associated H-X9-DG protein